MPSAGHPDCLLHTENQHAQGNAASGPHWKKGTYIGKGDITNLIQFTTSFAVAPATEGSIPAPIVGPSRSPRSPRHKAGLARPRV